MKYETTPAFDHDWARLSDAERELFRKIVRGPFNAACERFRASPGAVWPRSLRVRDVEGAPGIWELTWTFSGPDGRATFEWVRLGGELAVRWRRIGGHAIFGEP